MIGRRYWFTSIKHTQKNKFRFVDDNIMVAQRVGDVSIKRRDGEYSLISGVLYILVMKCNLVIIEKLLDKDYMIVMENKVMSVIDKRGNLVLKAPMSKNRTFKIDIHVLLSKMVRKKENKTIMNMVR